ncbi:MAG: hypothetical protein QOH58_2739 [Thermoleophilaceae bacterium]|jgi:hypothetical protein|nr:hypothetical protein [Thermoleophilaceae bacterium]
MSRVPELEHQLIAAASTRAVRRPRELLLTRVVLPAGTAVAAAVIAAVLLGGGASSVDSAAAAALRDAAAVARSQPATPLPREGEYLYVRVTSRPSLALAASPPFQRGIDSEEDFGFSVVVPSVQEVWVGEDGGRVRNANGQPAFVTDRDRRAWIAAGRPPLPGNEVFEDDFDTPLVRLDLPTDPDALYERLEREVAERGSDHGPAYMFTELVADWLRAWGATPAQRAALFEVAARIPGVEALGPRTDPAGREGLGFAMRDEDDNRVTLIVDPRTSQLLGEISVTLPGSPIPAGTVVESSTFSAPKIVDAVGER